MRRALTDEQVRKMRELRHQGATQMALAELFGVSQSLVSLIVRGHRFEEAGGPIDGEVFD